MNLLGWCVVAAGIALGVARLALSIARPRRLRRPARAAVITLQVSDEELASRRAAQDAAGWKPAQPRARKVSSALKAYALLATSADKGAVRNLALLGD